MRGCPGRRTVGLRYGLPSKAVRPAVDDLEHEAEDKHREQREPGAGGSGVDRVAEQQHEQREVQHDGDNQQPALGAGVPVDAQVSDTDHSVHDQERQARHLTDRVQREEQHECRGDTRRDEQADRAAVPHTSREDLGSSPDLATM